MVLRVFHHGRIGQRRRVAERIASGDVEAGAA
jgi:hypothetical protein